MFHDGALIEIASQRNLTQERLEGRLDPHNGRRIGGRLLTEVRSHRIARHELRERERHERDSETQEHERGRTAREEAGEGRTRNASHGHGASIVAPHPPQYDRSQMMVSSGLSTSGIVVPGPPGCPPGLRPEERRPERRRGLR